MPVKYTRENLIAAIEKFFADTGVVPTCDSIKQLVPSSSPWARIFGSWNNALREAGFPVHKNCDKLPPRRCGHCGIQLPDTAARSAKYCSKRCGNFARNAGKTQPRSGLRRQEYIAQLRNRIMTTMLAAEFETLSWEQQRKRVIHEQKGACARCGLSAWLGQQLTLEVDHVDGDSNNNSRSNLEGLCPNCHSLTPTWRGRNKKKHEARIDIDELKAALAAGSSLSGALRNQGRCGKGSGHARAKAALAAE